MHGFPIGVCLTLTKLILAMNQALFFQKYSATVLKVLTKHRPFSLWLAKAIQAVHGYYKQYRFQSTRRVRQRSSQYTGSMGVQSCLTEFLNFNVFSIATGIGQSLKQGLITIRPITSSSLKELAHRFQRLMKVLPDSINPNLRHMCFVPSGSNQTGPAQPRCGIATVRSLV